MPDIDRVQKIAPPATLAAAPERVTDQRRQKSRPDADRIELHEVEEETIEESSDPEDLVEAPNRVDFQA